MPSGLRATLGASWREESHGPVSVALVCLCTPPCPARACARVQQAGAGRLPGRRQRSGGTAPRRAADAGAGSADTRGAFVQPALYEAFGLTVIEAMTCGLPCFATNRGGPAEIIKNGISGYHIECGPSLPARELGTLLLSVSSYHCVP